MCAVRTSPVGCSTLIAVLPRLFANPPARKRRCIPPDGRRVSCIISRQKRTLSQNGVVTNLIIKISPELRPRQACIPSTSVQLSLYPMPPLVLLSLLFPLMCRVLWLSPYLTTTTSTACIPSTSVLRQLLHEIAASHRNFKKFLTSLLMTCKTCRPRAASSTEQLSLQARAAH